MVGESQAVKRWKTLKWIRSLMSSRNRQRTLSCWDQNVLDYLKRKKAEDPDFFYAVEGNEHSNGNIFWADSASRVNYNYFGDTVTLDTSYRTSSYRVPFCTFTGLNHHGQPVLFGCALLFKKCDSTFIWLLQIWLQAMLGREPVSITTDPDQFIQMAVAQVLPQARHRFCKWSIFRETQEKLSYISQRHPSFEMEFKKFILETEMVEEFESCWEALLERYSLMDDQWLQSIYGARYQWVPAYTRDTFFGELYITDTEPTNSFFNGYENVGTTMQSLITQYERAVTTWQEKELMADSETANTMPVLKTPSPMEKQAANLYTRRVFMKFQEELVETLANPATKLEESGTITTYRVAKFGEECKAHSVKFNSCDMEATCSCRLFEFSGIICRHVLSVFRAKNVLMLPPHYILKRWTRDAKEEGVAVKSAPDVPSNSHESLAVRHNNLRHEALKFVEEGAKSLHIYNVAMDAVQEAAKKVVASKKRNLEASDSGLSNGHTQERHASSENGDSPCCSADEKEKKIRELATELDIKNQRCEVYRANLLAVLRDMEDQKLKLSVKVQNARLSLKE